MNENVEGCVTIYSHKCS